MVGATPGPWEAIEFADGGEVVDSDGYEVADLNTGLIAINRHWLDEHDEHWSGHAPESYIERTQEEVDANARLVASAPDLLAACRVALRLSTWAVLSEETSSAHSHSERRADEYDAKVRAAEDQIRAAIAKAEGTEAPT
jgi:hypothetical protein